MDRSQVEGLKNWLDTQIIGGSLHQAAGWAFSYATLIFALFYGGQNWLLLTLKFLATAYAFVIVIALPPLAIAMLIMQASRSQQLLVGQADKARRQMRDAALGIAFALLSFAVVFAKLGLKDTASGTPIDPHDGWQALYFTVVTWTTVGYGDVVPLPGTYARLFAAWAALCGYLVMAFLIAAFVSLAGVAPRQPVKDKP